MDTIETRELFTDGDLSIIGHMVRDDMDPNFPDFEDEADEKEFKRHFENGDFEYVGLIVNVHFAGAEIGEDSIWGTEHGYIGNDINVDAWENVPAKYDYNEAEKLRSVQMGSVLNGVITEAIGNALAWACKHGNREMVVALKHASKWADPNAYENYVPAAGDAVIFPDALSGWNRTTRYGVAEVTDTHVRVRVATAAAGRSGDGTYTITLEEAREMGMRRAD